MVEEIIYTSAEKGLKQGSRGFCTVVSTTGMALNLAERLESMSGYRQAFPLHDPKASLNPVCWSHMTTRLAGRSLHVISRVADAGQDYTGRSNKLAHHLVIDNVASLISGPARMLAEPGVVTDRWDGTVRHIPPRDLRSASMPATIPLVAWKALTGDEGWAGSVAEQLLQSPAPVSIIFDPGTDTLTLVREVLDLIPAAQRWNVTFSTYFTRLLAGAECQLRFVLNDTPEATSLRNDARARVVNLTSPLPAAIGGTLVAMARQGQLTPLEIAPPQAATAARPRASVETSTKDTPKDTAAEISIPKLKPGLSPAESTDRPHSPPEFGAAQVRGSKKGVWIAVALALMFVIGTGSLFLLRDRNVADPFSDLVSKTVPQDQPPTQAEEDTARAREQEQKDSRDKKERELQEKLDAVEAAKKKAADDKMATDQQSEIARQAEMEALDKANRETKAALEIARPFAFIENDPTLRDAYSQWLFDIPRVTRDSHRQDPIPGPRLSTNGKPVILSWPKAAGVLFSECPYDIVIAENPNKPNEWIASAVTPTNTLDLATYTLEPLSTEGQPVGAADMQLYFRWKDNAERDIEAAELLRWWPLQITVSDRTAVLLQRTAETPQTNESKPTWKTIVASTEIHLTRNAAVDVVPLDLSPAVELKLELCQDNGMLGEMTTKISSATSPDSPESEAVVPKAAVAYFQLAQPMRLLLKRPSPEETPLGFGELSLSASKSKEYGIKLHPRVNLTLRLPSAPFLADLPDIKINDYLKQIIENPDAIQRFDATLTDAAIEALTKNADIFNRDFSRWHSQRIKALPPVAHFHKLQFVDLIDRATKSVDTNISQAKKRLNLAVAATNQITPLMRQAAISFPQNQAAILNADNELKLANARMDFVVKEFASKLPLFTEAMRRMRGELGKAVTALVPHHSDISVQVNAVEPKNCNIQVRCTISGQFATPGCDSGESIRVYFVESTSENWPKQLAPPEAK